MFRYYTPGSTIFSLLAAGILSLLKPRRRMSRQYDKAVEPSMSNIQRVVNSHVDCTAEVFGICILGAQKTAYSSRLVPGDRVYLEERNNSVEVLAGDIVISNAELPKDSNIPRVLSSGIPFDAYLGGRDVLHSSEDADFCSVIVFYKIDGVPPTKIEMK